MRKIFKKSIILYHVTSRTCSSTHNKWCGYDWWCINVCFVNYYSAISWRLQINILCTFLGLNPMVISVVVIMIISNLALARWAGLSAGQVGRCVNFKVVEWKVYLVIFSSANTKLLDQSFIWTAKSSNQSSTLIKFWQTYCFFVTN